MNIGIRVSLSCDFLRACWQEATTSHRDLSSVMTKRGGVGRWEGGVRGMESLYTHG